MPTLAVARDYLFALLNKGGTTTIPGAAPNASDNKTTWTQEEFEKLCFEFGVELDDVTSQKEMFVREQSKDGGKLTKEAKAAMSKLSDEVIYKIDTPANRYDLLSAESMALALRVFLQRMAPPRFTIHNVSRPLFSMVVDKSVHSVRDYVVCAVLRNIRFNANSYNSFIDFQDKLHSGLARKRTLASVGTHDLDKIIAASASKQFPTSDSPMQFKYTTLPKSEITFSPLNQGGRVLNCGTDGGLEEFYKNDRHISKFIPIISHLEQYPVIQDDAGNTLSLPPIINSDFSKIGTETQNIFIECTATDKHKASVLINQIVCAFSWHLEGTPFEVDAVEVKYADATTEVTPDLSLRTMTVDVPTVNKRVGININADECATLLSKMYLYASKLDEETVTVDIPAPRSDILHECDLIEDVAIGFGYDNIVKQEVPTYSYGHQSPVNKLTHLLRLELANAGYCEMLNFSLCSRNEAFSNLNRKDDDVAVHLANPQATEFQVCRPSLLPGALKSFAANKSQPLPIKLFEVSDVILAGDHPESNLVAVEGEKLGKYHPTGVHNRRHMCALHCCTESSGLELVHGVVEMALSRLGVAKISQTTSTAEAILAEVGTSAGGDSGALTMAYKLVEGADGAFFPGRAMNVVLVTLSEDQKSIGSERVIGHFGVIHPNTLKAFELTQPCSYCEIDIEPFI